jgi:hypothetical protein
MANKGRIAPGYRGYPTKKEISRGGCVWMTEVRCTVHSCEFWEKGDYCTAKKIWVKNNFTGDEDDDLFFRPEFEFAEEPEAETERSRQRGEEPAVYTSRQTCCETMRPKEERGGPHRGGCR